jgi:hypothetical protein
MLFAAGAALMATACERQPRSIDNDIAAADADATADANADANADAAVDFVPAPDADLNAMLSDSANESVSLDAALGDGGGGTGGSSSPPQ